MQKRLKILRLVVSSFMLVAIGFLFLDFSDSVPSAWFNAITWLQFTPSLIKFMQMLAHGLAVTAYGFAVVLLLTLLFGRVYCSYICPLGIFQDIVSWYSKVLRSSPKKKFRFRYTNPKSWLRYSILVVFFLSIFTGGIILDLLEPFSNFGRLVSDLLRPIYVVCNNLLARLFEATGSYVLYPVTIAKTDPFALIVPGAMLALVVGLAAWKGRLYCNTVCPVGTLLGLVSKISLFRIRFDIEKCNQCGNCMFACKSQCIDVKNRKVDFSRCVGCGNCLKLCDRNAIRYAFPPPKEPKLSLPVDTSKRKFVAGSLLLAVYSVQALAQPFQNPKRNKRGKPDAETADQGTTRKHAVSPPGSYAYEHFTKSCTACHLCVSACPTGVLKPAFLEYGFFGTMQPFMDFRANFCDHECIKCTEICPNGAILPLTVEEKITTQIGVARFIKHNCIAFTDESACRAWACVENCPTKAIRLVLYKNGKKLPEIIPDICTGCGACEYVCPATPKAFIVDGHLEHKKVRSSV